MPIEPSWYEQQLLAKLAEPIADGRIAIVREIEPLVKGLAQRFPILVNRINWQAVPGAEALDAPPERATSSFQLVEPATELRAFWERMRRVHNIDDDAEIIVFGDALLDVALRLSVRSFTQYLVEILRIPHHTYVFPSDWSWCFNYTMEDDANFGTPPVNG